MSTILVRYSEIGLKSDPVRRRFENILNQNMSAMLVADGVEALVKRGNARFYVECEDSDKAVASLRKVFGIASLSVATVTTPKLDDICEVTAEISKSELKDGMTFAVRARHDDGNQKYTSVDINKAVGSAILDANQGRGIKVNLNEPEKTFYIEVRCNKAYIFSSYIDCHAGLPLGSQGTVLATVDNDRGVVSAWLMMKRGCRVVVRGDYGSDILRKYDPNLKILAEDGKEPQKTLGYVFGTSVADFDTMNQADFSLPLFFPTIGMTDSKVGDILSEIEAE